MECAARGESPHAHDIEWCIVDLRGNEIVIGTFFLCVNSTLNSQKFRCG